MPRQEEQDYNDLLKCHHALQSQYRKEVQKNKSSKQRIKKLSSELATLKLRQQTPPTRRTTSHSHQEKDEKDDLLEVISRRLTDAEKQLDLLKLENQVKNASSSSSNNNNNNKQADDESLTMHLHELATQHKLDTLRLSLQEEKLRKIIQLHNQYKARHDAMKKELHFYEEERHQMEEYKEEFIELREQNHFLEQQVTKLCDGGNHEEEMEMLRDALSQKESAYELLLEEIIKLQRENEHLHLQLSRANHKAKDIRSCYRELEHLALEEAKLSESVDSSYAEDP